MIGPMPPKRHGRPANRNATRTRPKSPSAAAVEPYTSVPGLLGLSTRGAQPADDEAIWSQTRSGARAGRGFHYQDVVGAWICSQILCNAMVVDRLRPEGAEDLSCEGPRPWQIQVKSRQERVGDFSPGEVAAHLLKIADSHAARRLKGLPSKPVLVLERPIRGWAPTRWGIPLGEAPGNDALLAALLSRGRSESEISILTQEVCVFVLPWGTAAQQTREAIASHSALLPLATEPVVLALRNAVSDCSDTNAQSSWQMSASLDRTQIERVVTDSVALVDADALQEALSQGLCEPVDFDTRLDSPDFYEGVDVQPGHIAAGLPAPRPEVTADVVVSLEQCGSVLVTGPSGVGKSTVMWAAAYTTRHILWYRVRRLQEQDVEALLRLAKATMPTARSPVGFIVDAVGVGSIGAWDALQRELAPIPGTLLLGSARSEDLLPLRTVRNTTLVEVTLDAHVAAEIHAGLRRVGATTIPHWQEAFDAANGLTLEFTHLLTQGRRLSSVLTEQVNRRVTEGRDLELRIIALVSTAHRWSANLPLNVVQQNLSAATPEFRKALKRLADEHLILSQEDHLTGLHQLRSTTLSEAVHQAPPPTLRATVSSLLPLLNGLQLQQFVVGALTHNPELDNEISTQIANGLQQQHDPARLTHALHALRIVDFQRSATEWARVFDELGVQPAQRGITVQLAVASQEPWSMFAPEVSEALRRIDAQSEPSPLRDQLVDLLGTRKIVDTLMSCRDLSTAARLLAVLTGAELPLPSDTTSALVSALRSSTATELADLLAVARRASEPIAHLLFDLAGGEEVVFNKLRTHCPWLTVLTVENRDTEPTGRARLRHVSDAAIPDIDDYVRDLARVILRCLPMCDSVDVQALTTGDLPLQIGDHTNAHIKLSHKRDHPPSSVAWNRLRSQMATVATKPVNETARAATARDLIVDLSGYVDQLGRVWSVSRNIPAESKRVEAYRRSLLTRAHALTVPFNQVELFGISVDEGPSALSSDRLYTLVEGITQNLTRRLHDRNPNWAALAAYTMDTLVESAAQVRSAESWHLTGDSAPTQLTDIEKWLRDLHAILADLAWGELTPQQIANTARAGPYQMAIHRVADRARETSEARSTARIGALRAAAENAGVPLRVWARTTPNPKAWAWPPTQIAIGVNLTSLADWEASYQTAEGLLRRDSNLAALADPVLVFPLVDDQPIRQLALALRQQPLPDQDLFETWLIDIGTPTPTPLTDALTEAHQALQAISGLSELSTRRSGTDVLQHYADQENARLEQAMSTIEALGEPPDQVIDLIATYLFELGARVQDQIDDNASGMEPLAAGIARGATGTPTQDFAELNYALLLSLQWDVDPSTARDFLRND